MVLAFATSVRELLPLLFARRLPPEQRAMLEASLARCGAFLRDRDRRERQVV